MSYTLYAKFPQQQICRDRQYSGLLRWAAYQTALPIPPTKPDEDFVRERIVAEKIPTQADYYVAQTMSYVVATPDIQTNIRQHLNAFNDEATEAAMDLQVDGALSSTLPAYCRTQVSQSQIDQWYADNGFGAVAAA